MKWTIIKTNTEKIYFSQDKKTMSADVTVTAEGTEGDVKIPISVGPTIENIPLTLGADLPNYIDAETKKWFEKKYPSI